MKERIKLVIDMYKNGKTHREIASATHFNFVKIKKIIDEYELSRSDRNLSKRSQAYQLYSIRCKPLSVAIKLDIPADEAEKYYQQYLRLSDLGYLEEIISESSGNLREFLEFYDELIIHNISPDEIGELINLARNLTAAKSYKNELNNDIGKIKNEIQTSKAALSSLEYQKNKTYREILSLRASYLELFAKGLDKKLMLIQAFMIQHRILLIAALYAVIITVLKNQEFRALLPKPDSCESSIQSRFMKAAESELQEVILTCQVNQLIPSGFHDHESMNQ